MRLLKAKRLTLYSMIIALLLIDYMTMSGAIKTIEKISATGLLSTLFPILFVLIQVLTILLIKVNFSSLGIKRILLLSLLLVGSAYLFFILKDMNKLHFLEYELLTIIVYKAIEIDFKEWPVLTICLIVMAFLGLLEETIQAFHPQRTFDTNDLAIDFGASAIILCLIWISKKDNKWT